MDLLALWKFLQISYSPGTVLNSLCISFKSYTHLFGCNLQRM
uniref:Uncharacterized protein n=1 Tax=Rhizophora mucronata TaxID=61149 RepID=A0A2P2JG96_RHIMU